MSVEASEQEESWRSRGIREREASRRGLAVEEGEQNGHPFENVPDTDMDTQYRAIVLCASLCPVLMSLMVFNAQILKIAAAEGQGGQGQVGWLGSKQLYSGFERVSVTRLSSCKQNVWGNMIAMHYFLTASDVHHF